MKNIIASSSLLIIVLLTATCKKNEMPGKLAASANTGKTIKSMFQADCQPLQWLNRAGGYYIMIPDGKGYIYGMQGSNIAKIEEATGKVMWTHTNSLTFSKIRIDDQGNTYALSTIFTVGSYDTDTYQYLVKIDNTGKQVWSDLVGYTNNYEYIDGFPENYFAADFGTDGAGNCYLKGTYFVPETGSLDLITGRLYYPDQTPSGSIVTGSGAFLKKIAADGSVPMVTSQSNPGYIPAHIIVLKDGSYLLAGNHSQGGINRIDFQRFDKSGNKAGSVSFNTGNAYTGSDDCMLATDGSNLYVHTNNILVKITGSGQLAYVSVTPQQSITRTSMAVDKNGNVLFAGTYSAYSGSPDGLVDFDPGTGQWYLQLPSQKNLFIDEYDASGKFKGAAGFITDGTAYGPTILSTGDNYLYFTGFYTNTISIDPSSHFILNSPGTYGSFLVKYQLCQ